MQVNGRDGAHDDASACVHALVCIRQRGGRCTLLHVDVLNRGDELAEVKTQLQGSAMSRQDLHWVVYGFQEPDGYRPAKEMRGQPIRITSA